MRATACSRPLRGNGGETNPSAPDPFKRNNTALLCAVAAGLALIGLYEFAIGERAHAAACFICSLIVWLVWWYGSDGGSNRHE